MNIKQLVLKQLDKVCLSPSDGNSLNTKLLDLGLDELDVLDIVMLVEDEMLIDHDVDIEIEEDVIANMVTVQDIISAFEQKE